MASADLTKNDILIDSLQQIEFADFLDVAKFKKTFKNGCVQSSGLVSFLISTADLGNLVEKL